MFFTLTDRASTIPGNIRGCQSGTWSQRGTKVNGSHHGDNPLLRPKGIQIATKSYATLQAMAPTSNKTVHQTSFTPYREQPRSTRIVVAYPRPVIMHPFDLPEPLSDKSTLVLLDLSIVSNIFLVRHSSPDLEPLVLWSGYLLVPTVFNHTVHFHFFRLPSLFHSNECIACFQISTQVACAPLPTINTVYRPSPAKPSDPRHRTLTYSPRHLPRRLILSSAEDFPMLLLPHLPVYTRRLFVRDDIIGVRFLLMVSLQRAGSTGPSNSVRPSVSFASFSWSDGASRVSSSGNDGASRVFCHQW